MKNYSSKANIINRLIPLGAERNAGENKGEKKKNRKSYIFHYLALDRSFMYYFYVLEH
jgi:hypothetical protein